MLNVDDSRDPEQKKLKDDINRRDAELANEMEKTRLANEAALVAERAQEAKNAANAKKAKAPPVEPVIVYAHKPRLHKPHQPDGFKAVVPDTVRKSKKSRKKLPDSDL